MLPSLGFQEIVLLAVMALIIVGPKDLPLMLRKLGQWTARLRAMANEFRAGFDELARQAELDELRKEVDALRRMSPMHDFTNQAEELRDEVMRPIDPDPAAVAPEPEQPAPDSGAAVTTPEEAVGEKRDEATAPVPTTPAEAR